MKYVLPGLYIRGTIAWAGFVVIMAFHTIISPFTDKYTLFRRSLCLGTAFSNFLFRMEVVIIGADYLPKDGESYFLWGNHQTNWDNIYYGPVIPKRTSICGKHQLKKAPVYSQWFRASGNMFLERTNLQKAKEALSRWEDIIMKNKLSPFIFPEGTRNFVVTTHKWLERLKKGPIHVALNCHLPIYFVIAEPFYDPFHNREGLGFWEKRKVEFRILQEHIPKVDKVFDDPEEKRKVVNDIHNKATQLMFNAVKEYVEKKKLTMSPYQ